MDGPEAHQLAMNMEPYCVGNYNMFAHRTNIDPKSRLIVYDLRSMPKNMKEPRKVFSPEYFRLASFRRDSIKLEEAREGFFYAEKIGL